MEKVIYIPCNNVKTFIKWSDHFRKNYDFRNGTITNWRDMRCIRIVFTSRENWEEFVDLCSTFGKSFAAFYEVIEEILGVVRTDDAVV